MASITQCSRSSGLRTIANLLSRTAVRPIIPAPATTNRYRTWQSHAPTASFHASSRRTKGEGASRTDIGAMDILGNTPIPSSSIDVCTSSGFHLNSGAKTYDGSGVLLVGGEAFRWRPWVASPSRKFQLLNKKGQWDINLDALGLLSLVWPRPDLLILGLGPENRPVSPEVRKKISELGMRVDILDTGNAAAQFNLLARERGVDDVAAALIPIGWVEGVGAGQKVDGEFLSHE